MTLTLMKYSNLLVSVIFLFIHEHWSKTNKEKKEGKKSKINEK